ncbi:hypothetical protein MAPG_07298 [Magnaporthiopsis poae ATCC 64411]|uniref:Uncharacterized protein n=1 Tax=Magnaporthiopsis poae (strain ATCC 64411 / 73-15) TaxID=644358 RepID=A0A0C4E4A6_MAGP6|nr:hypothetical protein MAPG_07298 [Magnaporthiopsis poae ATCC 64411]
MLYLPQAKRVRREKLYDSGSGSESEPDGTEDAAAARAKLQEHLSSLLCFAVTPASTVEEDPGEDRAAEPAEEVFEFKLFSAPKAAGLPAPVTKVVLTPADTTADDGPADGGGFVVPRRPLSHYVAPEPSAEQRARWEMSAVTGEEVLARSTQRCWGLEKPWRLTRIVISADAGKKGGSGSKTNTATAAVGAANGSSTDAAGESKKKRPGKRRRIATRVKAKALKEEQAKLQTKEEHLREKKKRLNREKQLKRRQKERERKQALRGEAADGGGTEAAGG